MELYIYAKSSHRDGLENMRRCAAYAKLLEEFSPTLCTGDYRAATVAKQTLDIKRTMGIDAVGNLPHTMERLDMLIYDNDEVTQQIDQQMRAYCTRLYKISRELPVTCVDPHFFDKGASERLEGVFFGDDDYQKWFVSFCRESDLYEIPLLNGNYFFLDTTKEFEKSFTEVVDEEEYLSFIASSKYLLSGSLHAVFESLAAGNKPVFFHRGDKELEHIKLLEEYNVPVAHGEDLDALIKDFRTISQEYPQTKTFSNPDLKEIKEQIAQTFKEYAHIKPAIDYGYYYAD